MPLGSRASLDDFRRFHAEKVNDKKIFQFLFIKSKFCEDFVKGL